MIAKPKIFNCHRCAGTLDAGNAVRDVEITVLDIDSIVHKTGIYSIGKKICPSYPTHYFLRDLYEQYNKPDASGALGVSHTREFGGSYLGTQP